MKKTNAKVLCLLFLLPVLVLSCTKETKTVKEQEEVTEIVKTMILHKRSVQRQIKVCGNLEAYETHNITPSLQGSIIEHIMVDIGSKVKKGDVLVRMDQTQYNNTRLSLTNLKTELERLEELLESGSVSQQSYDQMKLSYDQTKENCDYLRDNTFVKAPTNGEISAKYNEDGELSSGPILQMVYTDKLKVIISIPESYLTQVKEGMKLAINSDIYSSMTFYGNIEVIYPTIDPSTHTFQCKVVIPNPNHVLKPGMYVTTTLNIGKGDAIAVPYQSVEKLVGSNERYVFLNENGRAKRVSVQLGQRIDEDIEIIAPEIVEGAEYVYVGQYKLVDGIKLNVVE